MNSEEQTLIDGLFSRLQQAETEAAPRDAQAEARIKEHLTRQPAAGYFMTQAILVQEAAIKSLDEQNKQLQAELSQARAQVALLDRIDRRHGHVAVPLHAQVHGVVHAGGERVARQRGQDRGGDEGDA